MNKLVVILALVIISCNKKETVSETSTALDSATFARSAVSDSTEDTGRRLMTPEAGNSTSVSNAFRSIEDGKIIKTINADMLPLALSDEFTAQQREYVIKIMNYDRQNISGEIVPQNPEMNIRFNRIRVPNGKFDGPFGREIIYKTRDKGEIWLIIGKSNMSSGIATGKFSVNIK